ncbi:hypothetical protein AB6D66_03430, partial [Vibrio pomeroyi]
MKTFVVVTKPVKHSSAGIIARERYLKSESHPNHTNTEAIFDVVGMRISVIANACFGLFRTPEP